MNKKDYQEPTMMVVKLQHRENVLQASGGVQATMRNGGSFTETDDWDEE